MTGADAFKEFNDTEHARLELETAWADLRRAAAKSRDRSYLGRTVVDASIGVVLILIVYVLVGSLLAPGGWETIKVPANYTMDIISTVLLPLVTLVLGHYFGTVHKGE